MNIVKFLYWKNIFKIKIKQKITIYSFQGTPENHKKKTATLVK